MTLAITTDIYAAIGGLYPVLQNLTGDHQAALTEALAKPSPVDTVSEALEALYAAVKDGAFVAGSRDAVVTACNQMAYLATFYQWHGKTQRGADITVAMNAITDGADPATACAAIDVDARFAASVPVAPAPSVH